jgi:putative endonuclease
MAERVRTATTGSAAPRARGQVVETAAAEHLQQQGLLLIERNFTSRGGEIDLVMRDGETLVFVEVRFRKSDRFGTPVESITASKQRKLVQTAQLYLLAHPVWRNQPCRFDIVAARPADSGGDNGLQFEWIKNAFA